MARAVMLIGALAVVICWGYSVLAPERFGSCSEIAVRFGCSPTVRDCRAYGPADFLVPLGALIAVVLLVGDDDFEIDLGTLGKFSRRRVAAQTAARLAESRPATDRRGAAFIGSFGDPDRHGPGTRD